MCDKGAFDAIAPSYIAEDGHWGAEIDFLEGTLRKFAGRARREIRYLDLGCGPGFHLVAATRLFPKCSVTGIDFSHQMLFEARKRLNRYGMRGVALRQVNILQLTDPQKYDVVTCLNNVVGNLYVEKEAPRDVRTKAIRKMHSVARRGGLLLVSVYNRKEVDVQYGRNLKILPESDLSEGDLFIEYQPQGQKTTRYYSHWFTEGELIGLLEQNDFKVELLEKRRARLVVRARAV